MSHILALGLNPAYQKSLVFEELSVGHVNRAKKLRVTVGGKGQTFAKAARILSPSSTILAQFLGGFTGSWVKHQVAQSTIDLPNADKFNISVETKDPTRTCTTLLCEKTKQMTELIDPSPQISSNEKQTMIQCINDCLTNENIKAIAICGTAPGNVPQSFYANIARLKPSNCLVLLDSYKGVQEVLGTKMVDILKINIDELFALAKTIVTENIPSTVHGCVNACFKAFSLKYIALTDGPKNSYLYQNVEKIASSQVLKSTEKCFTYKMPSIDVVNPIGAGDTASAVFVYYLVNSPNMPVHQAFRNGLAAACASCLSINGAEFTLEEMERMYGRIRVHKSDGIVGSISPQSKL